MQKFYKTCCYFGQNSKRKGILSASNFARQLPNILFECLCFCVRVLRVVVVAKLQGECFTSLFDGSLNSMIEGDDF